MTPEEIKCVRRKRAEYDFRCKHREFANAYAALQSIIKRSQNGDAALLELQARPFWWWYKWLVRDKGQGNLELSPNVLVRPSMSDHADLVIMFYPYEK